MKEGAPRGAFFFSNGPVDDGHPRLFQLPPDGGAGTPSVPRATPE
jgi:hypothetical protein